MWEDGVLGGGSLLIVPAFMRTYHLDFLDATISFLNSHTALLCLLVQRACMWCCLPIRRTCSHVSRSGELHMGHVIDGKASLPKNNCYMAFLVYWPWLRFKRHVFWELVMFLFVQNLFDSSSSIFSSYLCWDIARGSILELYSYHILWDVFQEI